MKEIILTIILLIYTNLIRFLELKSNTSMITWKQYWMNNNGIVYSLNIIGIIGLITLFSWTKTTLK